MFEKQIAKGMLYLDTHVPGWEHRINLDKLHMSTCLSCAWGQLFGVADCGDAIDEHPLYMEARGFILIRGHKYYGILTKEWKQAILKRREEHGETKEAADQGTRALQVV